tara:strand:+ start:67 stop:759 length:693 start_codon:yes stop_codon:yes gene_type:complete
MYHSISDGKHPLSLSINNFEKQMKFMFNNGYQTINFDGLNSCTSESYNKYFIVTFDDGYEDIFLNALPILKKYNFISTCFFVSNYIGKYNIWDECRQDFIKLSLMNIDQIKNWNNQGMQVGLHTAIHKNLNKINYNEKLQQIELPKKFFYEKLSINVDSFSYPFGRYDDESFQIVKRNYNFAVTTKRSRYIKNKFDLCKLPRIPVNKGDGMFKFYLKVKTIYEDIKYNEN